MFTDYELEKSQMNKLPNVNIQTNIIDSLEKVCNVKQKEVNEELENSIQILQDSQTYVLQCVMGIPLGFDSVCTRNRIINF
jgi:hypothetical protein